MSTRKNNRRIQGPSTKHGGRTIAEVWEEEIWERLRVECTIHPKIHEITVEADNYPDYVLAKKIIQEKTNLPVLEAKQQGLGV